MQSESRVNFWQIDNIKSILGAQWLQRPAGNVVVDGIATDSRGDLGGKIFVAIKGERFDGHAFLRAAADAGAPAMLVEQKIPHEQLPLGAAVLLVDHCRKGLARLALAYRRALRGTKVIAIAGSAGKTTTKVLIDGALRGSMPGSMSPKSFNNDLGVPLTILN